MDTEADTCQDVLAPAPVGIRSNDNKGAPTDDPANGNDTIDKISLIIKTEKKSLTPFGLGWMGIAGGSVRQLGSTQRGFSFLPYPPFPPLISTMREYLYYPVFSV